MNTVAEGVQESPATILHREIEDARNSHRLLSRTMLAHTLHERAGIPLREAEEFVDAYCDEKEPGIPTFLSSEFGTPYLKVLAVFNVVLAGLCFFIGVRLVPPDYRMWAAILAGTVFLGGAVFCWLQSMAPKSKTKKKKSASTGPHIEFTGDHR